jgi:hypothetical protein
VTRPLPLTKCPAQSSWPCPKGQLNIGISKNSSNDGEDLIVKKLAQVVVFAGLLFALAAPAHAQKKADIAFDYGAAGVWVRYADVGFRQLNPLNPDEMASGDVDGNGQSDLILDFPGQGVWIWLNDSQWLPLHTLNATQIITADLDGNGRRAVLLDFPGLGIWVWRYNIGWSPLHTLNPHTMAAGDLDGNGRADVLIDFPGFGVWVWMNNQWWSQLNARNVTSITVGDLDGNGRKDVLLDFPGIGIWLWSNNTSWSQLNTRGASLMTTADLDGNGQDEAIIDFAGSGVWVWRNGAGWSVLHPFDAETLTAADLDGNGRSDLVVDFGAAGLWTWWNNAGWTQLDRQSPEGSLAGNFALYRPPTVSFGTGTYRVGAQPLLPAGRYYTDPFYGCYWERLSGLGGTLGEINANDFVGYDAAQIIVDIRSTDYAFSTDSDCSTWYSTPRRGLQANITPGMWLVGSQVTPGTYWSNVNHGCYWERLRNFDGTLSAIIDNEFIDTPSVQYVQVSSSDVGFNTDGDCGTWQRVSGSVTSFSVNQPVNAPVSSPSDIEQNRTMRRRKNGLPD